MQTLSFSIVARLKKRATTRRGTPPSAAVGRSAATKPRGRGWMCSARGCCVGSPMPCGIDALRWRRSQLFLSAARAIDCASRRRQPSCPQAHCPLLYGCRSTLWTRSLPVLRLPHRSLCSIGLTLSTRLLFTLTFPRDQSR